MIPLQKHVLLTLEVKDFPWEKACDRYLRVHIINRKRDDDGFKGVRMTLKRHENDMSVLVCRVK
jgi:hypothetical protein